MRVSWNDPLSGGFRELLLQTLADEGEELALARLVAKLDEAALATRRANLHLLTIIPSTTALEWLDARIETPVVEQWGITASLLGIRWQRLAAWMTRGRPHSLAALDALVAYAHPGPGTSVLHRAVQPLLVDPPSLADLRDALAAFAASDDSPRATKTVSDILARASEILRGGSPSGISARAFWQRNVAEHQAERLLWSEGSRDLPVPEHKLIAGPDLGTAWQRRWQAAVSACERRGGTGSVRVGRTLERAQLAAIEGELGFAIPDSLADLFTPIAADVDFSWRLPDDCELPAEFRELAWGGCTWDARRLLELERNRRGWVDAVFPNGDDEYDRVWRDKLAILDVPNGDLIAIDISRADRAPVVYLSHDGGQGHGRVLGNSVLDFIDRWILVACVGPEDWLMTPFLHPDRPYLDAVGEAAHAWRRWFGLDVVTRA
jgi:hypothetical protein